VGIEEDLFVSDDDFDCAIVSIPLKGSIIRMQPMDSETHLKPLAGGRLVLAAAFWGYRTFWPEKACESLFTGCAGTAESMPGSAPTQPGERWRNPSSHYYRNYFADYDHLLALPICHSLPAEVPRKSISSIPAYN
jgi:hypothetical protein